ncbi:MAG: ABC transporter permease [Oscillospiraceae bacterium]
MSINETPEKMKRTSRTLTVLKRLVDRKASIVGIIVILLFILVAIFADVIAPYDYAEMTDAYGEGPSLQHLMGTDSLGRDLFSRVVYGTRYSLLLGAGGTLVCLIGGIFFGALAGFYGGIFDEILMRVADVIQSVPGVLLNMAVSVAFGSGLVNTMIALGVCNIAGVARLQRSAILSVRKMEYLDAAVSINCSDFRQIVKHILPNSFSPILVYATMEIGNIIMSAAGLSFLGLGVQPPTPEWGALLSAGRDFIKNAPYLTICPGVVLIIFVLAVNLVGDGLRDALDPKMKK